jgi:four helix bundle protein
MSEPEALPKMRKSESGMRNGPDPTSECDLKNRTKAFALRILKLVDALPKTTAGRALASQIVRSRTSVAANYRAPCRAKSTAVFIAKMGTVEEEADELIAITVASIKTARRNRTANSEFRIPNSEFA